MTRLSSRLAAIAGAALALSLLSVDVADARRGGSFGSRGSRTYQAPPPTRTAPQQTAPVQRSMTPPTKAGAPAAAPTAAGAQAQAPGRRGFFGGMGGGILGGLVAGGLLGMMLGHGWGGMGAGMGNTLLQILLIGGGIWLVMTLFRRRNAQPAGYPREAAFSGGPQPFGANRGFDGADTGPRTTYTPQTGPSAGPAPVETHDIGLTQADRDAFERLLVEVQDAFGREDYAGLRAITTPEIMSYLAEELSENATHGRRNDVTGTKLIQADIAEAWAEGDTDYATAAMRYESTDVMKDRQTGEVLGGDAAGPSETTELWTFVRQPGQPWKLSAIQEA